MPQANIYTVLAALVSGVVGGIAVALLTYWLTRRKTLAEIKFIEAQAEKIQRELNVVNFKIAGSTERVIYDSSGRDVGFDFQGSQAQIWQRIDGVDKAISGHGLGRLALDNGVLSIERSNTEGRFEVWLKTYFFDGQAAPSITRSDLISGERAIRISFEAKAVGASHTLRVLLKNEKTDKWLAEESHIISTNAWTPIKIYFQISPAEECRLRIDDLDVTSTPSSVQIRSFAVVERYPI